MAKPATLRDLIASWRSAARLLEGNATAARRAGDVEAAIISTERAKGIDACADGLEHYIGGPAEGTWQELVAEFSASCMRKPSPDEPC